MVNEEWKQEFVKMATLLSVLTSNRAPIHPTRITRPFGGSLAATRHARPIKKLETH